mmetsp:Transcript_15462/g.29248  ORF Transcript_15462/g.29248 Transcript_15462/m.29248 type:complete len:310 (+) Transcript_15462:84-1013(+)
MCFLRSVLLFSLCGKALTYNQYGGNGNGNSNNNGNNYYGSGNGNNNYGNTNYGNNNYGYSNNNYGQSNYGSHQYGYSDDQPQQNIYLKVCDDSVVQVTSVTILCTSPYTFYYGNGAHRNDIVCNYGDKANVEVQFQVIDDIGEVSDFYMTMALADQEGHLLAVTDPAFVCNDYVGGSCTKAGSYSFTTKLRLETPEYYSTRNKNFVPNIKMAFSTMSNHGYNLGALNTECKAWDNERPSYVSWSNHPRATGQRLFFQRNGALVGTCAMLSIIIAFVWVQSARNTAPYSLDDEVYGKDSSAVSRTIALVA